MENLLLLAVEARSNAYAPYSGYAVGAALLDLSGSVWTGCNVENVSYGATLCAERVAIGNMVTNGQRVAIAMAISTRDGGTPCGICLQSLMEFAQDASEFRVIVGADGGNCKEFSLLELMPHGFASGKV